MGMKLGQASPLNKGGKAKNTGELKINALIPN